nr:uncharacterized protein LOC114924074 isoform X7 [Arachis hypogaea]
MPLSSMKPAATPCATSSMTNPSQILTSFKGLPRANGLLHAQGTRVAVAYQNETKSFWGQMLYYVLTTGSGQQTLGEEYCDTTQVHYFHCIPDSYSLYSRSY